MKILKYKIKAILGMNYKSFFSTINKIHNKTNKNKLIIFMDIIRCQIKYGSGHNDYRKFEFYNLTDKQKDTYLTRVRNKKIIEFLNDKKYHDYFDDKALFNKTFKKFLKRDVLDLCNCSYKKFDTFVNEHKYIFCKPPRGDSGKGIERLSKSDFENNKKMYEYLLEKKLTVLEEEVKQNKELNKVNSASVNCLRIVTVVNNNNVDLIYGVIKFGSGNSYVDNMGFGAMSAPIDLKTGVIYEHAIDEHENIIESHPVSKVKFKGIKIPMFDKVVDIVKEAALVIPNIRQVGWDVCITENDVAIIEGNDWTDYMFAQLPLHTKNKIGLMSYYNKIIKKV